MFIDKSATAYLYYGLTLNISYFVKNSGSLFPTSSYVIQLGEVLTVVTCVNEWEMHCVRQEMP